MRQRPWQAPSVQALANQMAERRKEATPLLIEGPAGPVISAVGSKRDHRLASDALAALQQKRVHSGQPMPTHPLGRNVAAYGGGRSFGAVYEYRDSFGVPKIVGATGSTPEAAFETDQKKHQGIRNLMQRQNGQSKVVWAGAGTFPLGQAEMRSITDEIVDQRSKQFQLRKLRGHKPYSRHGY